MTRPPFQRGGRFLFLVYKRKKHCRYIIESTAKPLALAVGSVKRNFLLEGYYEIIETGIH